MEKRVKRSRTTYPFRWAKKPADDDGPDGAQIFGPCFASESTARKWLPDNCTDAFVYTLVQVRVDGLPLERKTTFSIGPTQRDMLTPETADAVEYVTIGKASVAKDDEPDA